MKIRYSDSTNEIEINPSRNDLLNLSNKLLEDGAQITATIEENSKAAPYERFLSGIKVKVLPKELVEFQVTSNDRLLIKGDRHKLSMLCEVLLSLTEDWSIGEYPTYKHLHIEHLTFDYLSSNSIPIVVVYA
ncbi:MAG: hypothetical protein KI793_20850 [Rivularia sp. (in: Bacteria)]|nr:hypothetical protein [Rivularia sp. MS3]